LTKHRSRSLSPSGLSKRKNSTKITRSGSPRSLQRSKLSKSARLERERALIKAARLQSRSPTGNNRNNRNSRERSVHEETKNKNRRIDLDLQVSSTSDAEKKTMVNDQIEKEKLIQSVLRKNELDFEKPSKYQIAPKEITPKERNKEELNSQGDFDPKTQELEARLKAAEETARIALEKARVLEREKEQQQSEHSILAPSSVRQSINEETTQNHNEKFQPLQLAKRVDSNKEDSLEDQRKRQLAERRRTEEEERKATLKFNEIKERIRRNTEIEKLSADTRNEKDEATPLGESYNKSEVSHDRDEDHHRVEVNTPVSRSRSLWDRNSMREEDYVAADHLDTFIGDERPMGIQAITAVDVLEESEIQSVTQSQGASSPMSTSGLEISRIGPSLRNLKSTPASTSTIAGINLYSSSTSKINTPSSPTRSRFSFSSRFSHGNGIQKKVLASPTSQMSRSNSKQIIEKKKDPSARKNNAHLYHDSQNNDPAACCCVIS